AETLTAAMAGPAMVIEGEAPPPVGLMHDHGTGVMIAPAMAPQSLIEPASTALEIPPPAMPEPAKITVGGEAPADDGRPGPVPSATFEEPPPDAAEAGPPVPAPRAGTEPPPAVSIG